MGRVLIDILLLQLCVWAAADTVYITDLPSYSSLAPCAQYAISYQVLGLTESACPEAVTALASCACAKDNNSASVNSAISSSILGYYCSVTASEDVASASAVFSGYCNQGSPAPAITPAPTLVSQYITDISAFSYLAPCAQSGLYDAVFYLTDSVCPDGQSALQSCACTKDQNSLAASERLNSDVMSYCGTTATEDVASAEAIFAGYCKMGNGTTSFPPLGSISGKITYYITDLPVYMSLAPCASSAVSEIVQQLTEASCQSAYNALASCACFKDQNSAAISELIISSVGYECSSTASADITSALGVFGFYCSAAEGKVVATGVTASVAVVTAVPSSSGKGGTSGGAIPVGTATSPGASSTAPVGSSGGSSGASSSPSSVASGGSSNVALIGGVVGGVVGGLALIAIGLAIWLCRRRRHQPVTLPSTAGSSPNEESKVDFELHQYSKISTPPPKGQEGAYEVPAGQGISEMPNQAAYVQTQGKYPPSQHTKISSPSMHAVSPVYEAGGRSNVPEMTGQGQLNAAQIDGRPGVPQLDGRPAIPEMSNYNNSGYYPQQQAQHLQQQQVYPNPVYEMEPGQQMPQQQPPQQYHDQPHMAASYNNVGSVYEM